MKIVSFLGSSAVMIISSIVFAIILLDEKDFKLNKNKFVAIIVGIFTYSLIALYVENTLKTLLICVIYVMLYRKIFKISYDKAIFMAFIHMIIMLVSDTLVLITCLFILKINPTICYTKLSGSFLITAIVCALLLLISFIPRKPLRKLVEMKLDNSKNILIYIILTLGCILVIFYDTFTNVVIDGNLIVSILIMIVFVVILYSLINQKVENNKIIEKYDKFLEFIKKYEVEIEEQKMLRHESKNQLITIKSKIVNPKSNAKLIEYINSIVNDYKSYDEEKYAKFQYLPANGLKGLFYYKAMEAEERKIKLSINITSRIENSFLEDLPTEDFKQLGRIVGIYLDNAIEASSISKDKKMGIEIYEYDDNITIIITNTYTGVIDNKSIGKVRYTTKGKNRGYGLMMVNKILGENARFKTERDITNDLYIQKTKDYEEERLLTNNMLIVF